MLYEMYEIVNDIGCKWVLLSDIKTWIWKRRELVDCRHSFFALFIIFDVELTEDSEVVVYCDWNPPKI